jgi:hypothetical protein
MIIILAPFVPPLLQGRGGGRGFEGAKPLQSTLSEQSKLTSERRKKGAKERQEKIKQAIRQTFVESGTTKLNFSQIKRGIDVRIPGVHRYFRDALHAKERDWDLEIKEVLDQLRGEEKIILSGIDDYEISDDWLMEGDLNGD